MLDTEIGRKGLLSFIKALSGSNVIKVVPSTSSGQVPDGGSASVSRATEKRLKVICGSNTSYIGDSAWIKAPAGKNGRSGTPLSICEVRVSASNAVKPNIGSLELAEALDRVLPFTAKEDNRPVLQCVLFRAKDGKLMLVTADGFRLAEVQLDFDGEGEALIHRDNLAGIANALRKAKRAYIGFEKHTETQLTSLVLDTELVRYKWLGVDGTFPVYEKLIPTETPIVAHFDTIEAGKALASLRVLAESKAYPIICHLNGGLVLSCADDKGTATIPADISGGEVAVKVDGRYLTDAFKACKGLVDMKLRDNHSPFMLTADAFNLVVMPMAMTPGESAPKTKSETPEVPEGESLEADAAKVEAVAEAERIATAPPAEPKLAKRRKHREPVTV